MRELINVLNEIINTIPKTETVILHRLDNLKGSVLCTAPELMHEWWYRTHDVLTENVPEKPTEDWQWKILSIFSTRTVDELKKDLNDMNL